MKFGPVPVEEAVGAIAAHSRARRARRVVRKGSTLHAEDDARRLRAAGIDTIVAVRLDPGDVGEDEAAQRLAEALAGEHVAVERPFTGRSNLFATRAGILVVDRAGDRPASTRSTRRSRPRRCRPTSRWSTAR